MLSIINNKNIEWSKEDTFKMPVSSELGFEEGTKLRFDISQNEENAPVISKTYTLIDNMFNVVLEVDERKKLTIGDYFYRIIILRESGDIITEKSGDFIVKWGA